MKLAHRCSSASASSSVFSSSHSSHSSHTSNGKHLAVPSSSLSSSSSSAPFSVSRRAANLKLMLGASLGLTTLSAVAGVRPAQAKNGDMYRDFAGSEGSSKYGAVGPTLAEMGCEKVTDLKKRTQCVKKARRAMNEQLQAEIDRRGFRTA